MIKLTKLQKNKNKNKQMKKPTNFFRTLEVGQKGKKERGRKNVSELMAKTIPNLMKNINLHIQ